MRVVGQRGYESLQARWIARSIRSGRWRDPEIALLVHLVSPGDTAVDVGANFGLYSFHLAQIVGSGGQVIAIEAVPSTCRSLRRTLGLLGVSDSVKVIERGVSDRAGMGTFVLPKRPDGSVDTGVAWAPPPSEAGDGDTGVRVEMARLDDLVGAAPADFLKIDTEGAELFVLRGAAGLIDRSAPTVLLEVSPSTLARQGLERRDLEDLLDSHGYVTYRFDPAATRLVPQPVTQTNGNLLAVHPSRAARIRPLL